MVHLGSSMYLEQLTALQQWVDELDAEIAEIFKRNEGCQRLATVPGIGPLVAEPPPIFLDTNLG
ncbi:hypothetical protein CA603_18105 [Paraburkholderia hospita]|nr:hypothetical protein CA603_18105 [Paraburkholderia hospita]